MSNPISYSFLLVALFSLSGCAADGALTDRYATAARIARQSGFDGDYVKTKTFTLTTYRRTVKRGAPVNIYIEGDGAAWISRSWPPANPTPKNPVALELASLDPADNVVYLARPGQYVAPRSSRVDPAYWTERRFAPEVVAALNEAIDALMSKTGGGRINLIGYSGGAALAVLIAAQRSDVLSLRTVAGNLDPEAVNRYHGVSPPAGSLNPLEKAEKLCDLPQRHFIGAGDAVIPSAVAVAFIKRAGSRDASEITTVAGATHGKGWRREWKSLLALPLCTPVRGCRSQ